MIDFKLPELGENVTTAEIIRVLVREGDPVEAEQTVLEVESEKAAMGLPCPYAGRVARVHVREGDQVAVGQTLLSIEAREDGQASAEQRPAAAVEQVEPPATPAQSAARADERQLESPKPAEPPPAAEGTPQIKPGERPAETGPPASETAAVAAGPATRRLARELGIDLGQVAGSAAGGRITREDVQAAVRQQLRAGGPAAPLLPDFAQWGPVERQALQPMARTAARRLQRAWQLVPHVTQHALADITDLEAARRNLQAEAGPDTVKITLTALAIKAAVVALRTFPHFNSSLDADRGELVLKRYYHIGVAVDTPHGLVVPVVRDADRKSVRQIAATLAELAQKARNRTLSADDLQGGTFTVSNLGGIGGSGFTPIVNWPEVAILGISRAQPQLVRRAGQLEDRLVLPLSLSLSYDHRVVNGADGARFVEKLAGLLAQPLNLLVEI
jgi:pyruvate dehydrogenase E2 component (dihydrolipoamide acetyltransferase)